MAFKLSDVNGYGTGALGDITNPPGQINSYANVTAMTANSVTIGTPSNGIYETFAVGKEILLHVAAKVTGTDPTYLGKYVVTTVTAVAGAVLTIDKNPLNELMIASELANNVVQAITIAQFNTLTVSMGNIAPLAYAVANKYGGVLPIKCKTGFVLSGGLINTVDKGIPVASVALRPLTAQETEMTTTGKTTGWENHITSRQLLLNAGDGVAFIIAKNTNNIAGTTTRIGGTAAGVAYFPYGQNDNNPIDVKGGSTILLVTDSINGFLPSMISKGKNAGAGYGRCHIATNTVLPNDEGLYSQDCISDKTRLRALGIGDFGDGALGSIVNPTGKINSYVPVTAVKGNVITVNMANAVNGIYDTFTVGTEIMFHVSGTNSTYAALTGKFFISKILAVNGNDITISNAIPFMDTLPANCYCQLITVPRFINLTINNTYTTLPWDKTKKIGGITAVKAKGTIDLSSGGKIINAPTYNNLFTIDLHPVLVTQCSGQQKDYLPLSCSGATLIIAKKLVGDINSRIGGTGSGAKFGGSVDPTETTVKGGGYAGVNYGTYAGGGYAQRTQNGNDGPSLFIVADECVNLFMDMYSTGGTGGNTYGDGGAGYGGGGYGATGAYAGSGGYTGGGTGNVAYGGYSENGGNSGTFYMYCNTVTTPNYTGVVV